MNEESQRPWFALLIVVGAAALLDFGSRLGWGRFPFVLAIAWSFGWRPGFDPWSLRLLFTLCLPGITALLAAALLSRHPR